MAQYDITVSVNLTANLSDKALKVVEERIAEGDMGVDDFEEWLASTVETIFSDDIDDQITASFASYLEYDIDSSASDDAYISVSTVDTKSSPRKIGRRASSLVIASVEEPPCPECGAEHPRLKHAIDAEDGTAVLTFSCRACGTNYQIVVDLDEINGHNASVRKQADEFLYQWLMELATKAGSYELQDAARAVQRLRGGDDVSSVIAMLEEAKSLPEAQEMRPFRDPMNSGGVSYGTIADDLDEIISELRDL